MATNPNIVAWDEENNEEDTSRDVEVNGAVPGGGGGDGAPTDASYVTTGSETDLDNESVHSSLSGSDLHDPKTHDSNDHSDDYVFDGDGAGRDIYVIAAGASDPADATAEDLIFEEE